MSKTLRIYNHVPPEYWQYREGFNQVVYCTVCKTLALYDDMPPYKSCKICGNRTRNRLKFIARWTETTKKVIWWNPLTWWKRRTGYWDLSTASLANIPDDDDVLAGSLLWGGSWKKSF